MHVNEPQNYLKVRGLKKWSRKNELVASIFYDMKKNIMPVKTPIKVEEGLDKKIWKETESRW